MRKIPLARLVAAVLVAVTTLLLGGYLVTTYRVDANDQRRNLRRLVALQTREAAVAVAPAVWNIDQPQIEKVLEAMAQPKSIYGITLRAAGATYGRRRDAQWNLVPWNGQREATGLLVEQQPVMHERKQIGTVRLLATSAFLEADLRALRIRLVTAIVAVELLLILSIYLVLLHTVVHPLIGIERYAAAVSAEDATSMLPASGAAIEVENLGSSIETMVNLLDHRYLALQEEVVRRTESEERFRTIFDSVNDAITIHDPDDGTIVDVNASYCEMIGLTREEAPRRRTATGLRLEQYVRENSRALIEKGPELQKLDELQLLHEDGDPFCVEVSLRSAMIRGTQRIICVTRDITQRRKMEEALRHSEQMSMLGALVVGVAHEVRNPLFGIAAALDAFEAEFGRRDPDAEYMPALRADVARLNRLMVDLLEYGKPQRFARHVQPIDGVVREAVRVCEPRARTKQVEIREEIGSHLPAVAIDADRILQVLKNVVENAIEFSPVGGLVTIAATADQNATLIFTISDGGLGFRVEDIPHLFEPFFTRRKGGSGLGLAIVQKIVNEHGGTIAARNGDTGGGIVEIRLPAS